MRIALFGAGRIGPLYARTLLDAGVLDGLTIMHVVPQRAVAAAQEFGATDVSTMAEALEAADAAAKGSAREHRLVQLREIPG